MKISKIIAYILSQFLRLWITASAAVLLSQEHLAGLMGITIPEVTRYCRLGKIPGAKKVGKYWFVEKSVLRNYMEG